jgi:glycosyltransferase involved in cell wall biosynthesis
MQEPLLSIALCTYNGEKYIKEQLGSILNQTYTRIEVIVVDDNSTDNTFDIISDYSKNDDRIKCFKNDINLGFNKNFEKAITLTSGDYIAISDQDDIWLPNKLRLLLNHIKDNLLIFSNSAFMGDTDPRLLLKDFKLPANYKGILLKNYVTGHTTLVHRDFLDLVLPFPQKGYYDWWMGFVASYHHKIVFLDEALTLYRVHDESVIKIRQDLGQEKLEEYETVGIMLNAFAGYKNLKPADQAFITQLQNGFQLKGSQVISFPLMKMVYNYYRELFPNLKWRGSLSKFFFARKFARGVRINKLD